ncbi:MAG: hypothetical protein JO322_13615 [Candidatus Eremiobacteraeota bacterium]|nr:hypothetical protein [Candidatus Eremiobacteraeota bacterium]
MLAALAQFNAPSATAFPILTPAPGKSPTASPAATTAPNVLPLNSRLTFILDGTISSATSKTDEMVNAHLKNALVVGSHTIASAGTPIQIRILDASPASNPDIYGFVDVFFEPLRLNDGRTIALRPPTGHLNVNSSAGHDSTVAVENTIGDVFTPTMLLHVFRKGRNFVLQPGAEVHALTEAAVQAMPNGTIAIMTPAPFVVEEATPHSSFHTMPLATPNPSYRPQMTTPTLGPGTPTPRP